ncbi:helix-turn-helix domain containing protein [Iamia majanohamensis]|uniref:Helix-turn-helix domain containing protein n=1 Tax=Iamia majanohamensis TaxID=467976 RepID=A0AAF0BX24_9ACTN|nr:TetR/AcrR family transcriptional regulator [Iamia majanohamensis]WCO68663.1 helix-turn-helix domain containing protein [Iamia majanohamensis]
MARSDTRERILAAALEAFARRGVEATSLDDVAEAVGVRKQTVLYWFRSKDALVGGVVEAAVAELGDALDRAVAARRPGRPATVAVVDEVLRLGARRPDLLVLLREVSRLGPSATGPLATAIGPRLDGAAAALSGPDADPAARDRARRRLVEAGARVVATAVEAQLLTEMGVAPDRAWLRRRRADLLAALAG